MRSRENYRPFGALLCAALAVLLATPAARGQEAWTTEDVIDDRIDEDAQYALMRMMSRGDMAAAFDASAILWEVKNGDLMGVYQADRGVPAQRIRAAGGNWWEVVPRGFDAICYWDIDEGKAMLIYRKGVGGIPERLDPALRSAWASCGIKPAAPRGYRVTITKPPPPPPPPEPELDPPPSNGLSVRVVDLDGNPLAESTVDIGHDGGGDAATTGASGTVTFPDVPSGAVTLEVIGPINCTDDWRDLVMGDEPLTVEVALDCTVVTPDPPAQCDSDKYSEVFDPCGKDVLRGAIDCLGPAYTGYAECGTDWKCAAEKLGEFWQCRNELDHKKRIRECNRKANEASGCDYADPQ
jgi:hypothetical protein